MGLIVTGRMRFLGKFEGVFPQLPPPTPSFTASPTSGLIPLTVQFTNTTTTGTGVTYQWDFNGDGVTDSTEVNPSYTYADTGTFTVSLTAISTGGSSTTTIANYITPYTIPPATFDGTNIEIIPVGLRVADVNTFLGININDIVTTLITDNSVSTILGININDIVPTLSTDNSVSTAIGTNINDIVPTLSTDNSVSTILGTTENEIPTYLSV